MHKQPALAKLLGGEPDEPAVQRMWGEISERLDRPRVRARWFILTPALLLACAVIVFVAFARDNKGTPHQELRAEDGQPIDHMVLDALAQAPRNIALSDGSKVQLEPGTELRTTVNTREALTVNLERGASTFEVSKIPGRTWTVRCAGVDVIVTGTKFHVARDENSVTVHVHEGSVLVVDTHGRKRNLRIGDSLRISTSLETGPETQRPDPVANPKVVPIEEKEKLLPKTKEARVTRNKPSPKRALVQALRAGDGPRALTLLGPNVRASSRLRSVLPSDLMTLADLARGENKPRVAVVPLQLLIEKHSKDRLAPLAAFTLGKLWLIELRDSKRAAAAFEKAIVLGLPKSLREQAYARRAEAYARSADTEAFHKASKAYKKAFPTGTLLKLSHRWLSQ